MTVAILLPGPAPSRSPPSRSSQRSGGRWPAHPFIPGGRSTGATANQGRRGGPARAMLGVVVPACGRRDPSGSRSEMGLGHA